MSSVKDKTIVALRKALDKQKKMTEIYRNSFFAMVDQYTETAAELPEPVDSWEKILADFQADTQQ